MNQAPEVATITTLRPHREAKDRRQEDAMITLNTTGTAGTPLSLVEFSALRRLHASYESVQHVFTKRELAWLRLLHWLAHSSVWNRAPDRADEHAAIVLANHERPGCAEVLSWTLGSIE